MDERTSARHDLAERIRQGHHRDAQRQRWIVGVLVVLGVGAALALWGWLQLRDSTDGRDIATPAHATDDYGFTLTSELAGGSAGGEPVEVKIFEDFLCSSCKAFHDESAGFLAEQLAAGTISITYHPFVFLLEASTDEYAQRAGNAAVCVADQAGVAAYAAMHDLLLAHQPAESGPGLSDERLIELAAQAGAGDIAGCVEKRTFTPWLEAALQAGRDADVTSTPTVRIGGSDVVRSRDGAQSIPGPEELRLVIESIR